jgi:uncharacterized protein
MRIENTVDVDAPLDRVWALVNDIPRVAPCMPGAALTGVLDDKTYEGTVAVKLGPLRMSYKGKVTVDEVDEANHSARLTASGKETKGAGTARASVETRLEPTDATHTRLQVTSDVQLTGKVASFGRGGAINDVATRLFGQFADCLRATLESEPTPAPTAAGTVGSAAGGADTAAPSEAAAAAGTAGSAAGGAGAVASSEAAAAGDGTTTTGAGGVPAPPATHGGETSVPTPASAATVTPASPPPPARAPEALDAGSLVGTVIKGRLTALFQAIAGFFRRLFGRRSGS